MRLLQAVAAQVHRMDPMVLAVAVVAQAVF
jgi:hypothetical protein